MKKGLRKVLVLVMAGVMTIAPAMTASAIEANQQQEWYDLSVRSRLHELFPAITDEHLNIITGGGDYDGWTQVEMDGYWEWLRQDGIGWADFDLVVKECWAYVCVLVETDRGKMLTGHSVLSYMDKDWCIRGGADAAELDSIIARLTGQAAPATATSSPSWKSDAKGWWIENPDGTYLTNQWYLYNGQWYYMGADGYMLTNTTTPDGYTVNADGVWIQ